MTDDWLHREVDDCPVDCDPAFIVQVSSDEGRCLACGCGVVMGDDE